jgi:hypothetical protein
LCTNTALNNLLDSIIQISEGWGNEVSYSNLIDISQKISQANFCSEFEAGSNFVSCNNNAANTFSGDIVQVNDGYGDDLRYSNEVDIAQKINQANFCDETGDGTNFAGCTNDAINTIDGDIVQVNDGHGKKADYSNLVDIDQEANQLNSCSESGLESNFADCSNTASNVVNAIEQTNDHEVVTATKPTVFQMK